MDHYRISIDWLKIIQELSEIKEGLILSDRYSDSVEMSV